VASSLGKTLIRGDYKTRALLSTLDSEDMDGDEDLQKLNKPYRKLLLQFAQDCKTTPTPAGSLTLLLSGCEVDFGPICFLLFM
jgi:hypothetical protein